MIRRRHSSRCSAAAPQPLAASAQQDGRMRRVGVLISFLRRIRRDAWFQAFHEARRPRLIEGRNLPPDALGGRMSHDSASTRGWSRRRLVSRPARSLLQRTRRPRSIPIVFAPFPPSRHCDRQQARLSQCHRPHEL